MRGRERRWPGRLRGGLRWLCAGALAACLSAAAGAAAAQTPDDEPAPPTEEVAATPQANEKRSEALADQRAAERRTEQAQANLEAVREVLDIGLAGDEAGQLLREARRRAPELAVVFDRVARRERQLAEARLNRVRLLEERRLTKDAGEVERLEEEITTQAAYLAALEGALKAERELSAKATELVRLLDSHLLWIASAPPIGPAWLPSVADGAGWAARPQSWGNAGRAVLRGAARNFVLTGLGLIAFVALLLARRRLIGKLSELAASVGKYATDSAALTVAALGVTLLLVLAAPLLLTGLGLLLVTHASDGFAQALGHGLFASAAVCFALDLGRQVCRNGGLADAHFGWNGLARRTLHRNLRWLLPIELVAALIVATTDASDTEVYRQGLGRVAFLFGALGVTIFVARVFRPSTGVFSELMSRTGWPWRLRSLWYGGVVATPIALMIAAARGYYFTASEIQSRFFATGLIVLAGIFSQSLFKRWLLVARRRLALQQARERLAEQRKVKRKGDSTDEESAASGEAVPELDIKSLDVTAASAQTLALLNTLTSVGVLAWLWAVWREILPALEILQSINLTDPVLDASGATVVAPVTAWAILLAVLTAVLTMIGARNLPAVLELVLLRRFTVDHGARYAAATLTRYVVIMLGVIVVSNLIGVDWSRAQWVVAALGVGLGFGLQEIVANFISGIIILFERPIRVGDTVTVGVDSGTVSRLRIRATTITDWDNKEILVPNKSFITDRVVNWTLSNPVTRIIVRVGVAYGSDEKLAQKVISDAVRSVPAVLEDPAFSVLFIGFGESSLDFEVRAFVSELAKRMPTTHDLHAAINCALKDAGIEIPFPQRDVHFKPDDPAPGASPGARRAPAAGDGGEPDDHDDHD